MKKNYTMSKLGVVCHRYDKRGDLDFSKWRKDFFFLRHLLVVISLDMQFNKVKDTIALPMCEVIEMNFTTDHFGVAICVRQQTANIPKSICKREHFYPRKHVCL